MEFRILGPIEVVRDGADITPRRAQQRAVLAMLVLRRNTVVPADDLIEALWGDEPTETAGTALQGHISALRKLLGADRIATRAPGYVLRVEPGELDADRAETMLSEARTTQDPHTRLDLLRRALDLWRGDALADLVGERFAQSAIAGLGELRRSSEEERLQAELDLGRHVELVPELERRVRAEPLRERMRAQLMLALYRAGRAADALDVFQTGRRITSEELGLDPGALLQRLERQILDRDPALELPTVAVRPAEQARKAVTVVLIDVVGSSSDPEDLAESAPVLADARDIVERFGGSSEPMFATSLVALFGAARAHEDDQERAVRAALAVRDLVATTRNKARIGVDAGRALVTVTARKIDVTGEVLNAASRLQLGAPAGGVLVSDAVRSTTAAAIEYEPFAAGGWLARAARDALPVRHPRRNDVPFVGRDPELAVLERALERVTQRGIAQLVTIVGEPGSGKTRLVDEYRARHGEKGAQWLEGRCLPYGEGITLWALAEVVKDRAGITESDDPRSSLEKLRGAIATVVTDRDERSWLENGLAALVGIDRSQVGDRAQLFAAAQRFLESIAWTRPLVVVFEDLHWADPALLDFVEGLADGVNAAQLLVIATARPELVSTRPLWSGGKRNATVITLHPLDDASVERVVAAVLDGPTPAGLVRRAGGNPLFALELARIVGASAGAPLPETVDAVIAARLDTLAPDLRAAATDAAVIGEVFWSGAVAAISGTAQADVEAQLRRLLTNDVVRRSRTSAVRGQEQFSFVHVLVRDVAYERIPRQQRAQKHYAVAGWIEAVARERIADRAELIAHHYGSALGLIDESDARHSILRAKTAHYLRVAGERALTFDVDAAERLFRRGLELAAPDDAERAAILAGLATAVQEAGRVHQSVPLYEDAIRELDARGDPRAAPARLELARAFWNIGETTRHRALIDDAIAALEHGAIGADLTRAWFFKGRDILMQRGDANGCLPWIERAISGSEQVGALAVMVRSLQFRGLARWELGDHDGGVADLEEALRLGREGGVGFETAICYSNLAEVIARRAGPDKGLAICAEGIEFAQRRGLVYAAMWMRATELLMLYETGDWDTLLGRANSVLAWDRARGTTQITRIALSLKVEILVDRGELEDAAVIAGELMPLARKAGDVQALMEALPAVARLALARGDLAQARSLIVQARDASSANPAWRSHRIADCVRTALAANDIDLAADLLSRADTNVPRAKAAVASAQAALLEARDGAASAVKTYAEAVDRWRSFGHKVELAYALLGFGRCLLALRRHGAAAPLDESRAVFTEMGASECAAQVDALQTSAMSTDNTQTQAR